MDLGPRQFHRTADALLGKLADMLAPDAQLTLAIAFPGKPAQDIVLTNVDMQGAIDCIRRRMSAAAHPTTAGREGEAS